MSPRVRSSAAATLLVMSLSLLLTGCGSDDVTQERVARATRARGEIVIGAVWPWGSRARSLYREGIELALLEVVSMGGLMGRPVRLVQMDDQESVSEGRMVAQRLAANPDVVAVIGHMQSAVTVPAAAIYDLSGIILIAPAATDPELTTRGYEHVFRLSYTDREAGRQLAEFAARAGHDRVAIYYVRNGYGRALANAFEERGAELGIDVVARHSYEADASGNSRALEPVLREWKQLEPSAILLAAELPQAGVFLAEARAQGLDVPALAGDALGDPDLLELGVTVERTVIASVFHPADPRDEVQRFVGAFREVHGVMPDAAAALGYDAVRLLTHAMRQANSTVPSRVAHQLRSIRDWNGVTGTITFNEQGDPVEKAVVKLIVQNGMFEHLDEGSIPSGGAHQRPLFVGAAAK